jgi:hypothetical protein
MSSWELGSSVLVCKEEDGSKYPCLGVSDYVIASDDIDGQNTVVVMRRKTLQGWMWIMLLRL